MSKLHDKLSGISRQQSVWPQGTLVVHRCWLFPPLIPIFVLFSHTFLFPLTRAIIQKRYKKYFCPRKKQETEAEAEAMCPKLLVVLKLKNTHMQKKYQPLKKEEEEAVQDEGAGQSGGKGSWRRICQEGATQRFVIERCQVAGKHTPTHSWSAEKEELH